MNTNKFYELKNACPKCYLIRSIWEIANQSCDECNLTGIEIISKETCKSLLRAMPKVKLVYPPEIPDSKDPVEKYWFERYSTEEVIERLPKLLELYSETNRETPEDKLTVEESNAIAEIYKLTFYQLKIFAWRIVKNESCAESIVHETMIALIRYKNTLIDKVKRNKQNKYFGYLLKATKNFCWYEIFKGRREYELSKKIFGSKDEDETETGRPQIIENLSDLINQQEINEDIIFGSVGFDDTQVTSNLKIAKEILKDEDWKIVSLHFQEKYTFLQISKLLNKNHDTVQTKYYRAMDKVRKHYKKLLEN